MEHTHIFGGNASRLQSVFAKAARGEHISIVFLGSSITMGYQIEEQHQFTTILTQYFRHTFQNDDISGHNLSAPGMPSLHGLHLAYTELGQYAPDLILIDYAVNDQKNHMFREAYESLLVKCLSLPTHPAVLSFFVRGEKGYTCAPQMAAVCEYYGVPYVNIGTWLDEDIRAGIMRWRDYSYDNCHPGPVGHSYIGRCLTRLLQYVSKLPAAAETGLPAKGFYNNELAYLHFIPSSWEHTAGHHPEPLVINASCCTVFIGYFVGITEDFGTACLSLNGEPYHFMDSYRVHEWEHPVYEVVSLSKEKKMHHISLDMSPDMQKGENEKRFRLICLGIV